MCLALMASSDTGRRSTAHIMTTAYSLLLIPVESRSLVHCPVAGRWDMASAYAVKLARSLEDKTGKVTA